MAIWDQTLGKCLKLFRADVLSAADTGVTAVDLDPVYAVPVMATMAVAVPSCRAVLRMFKNLSDDKPRLHTSLGSVSDTTPDSVRSVFEVLSDVRNGQATVELDAELANLMDEPDWKEVDRRLDDAVKNWCKERPAGAGSPPDQAEMVRVLLSLIRNVREASYRELFAENYRQIVSVDRRDRSRVDDVVVSLRAEPEDEDSTGSSDVNASETQKSEYLDFRGKTPTQIETILRQSGKFVILGEPGAGKSTLLRYLAVTCAESESKDPLLPIFLRLRDYVGGRQVLISESAVSFAEDVLQLRMHEGFFEDALSNGRCLVCLDALDEVPARETVRIVRRVESLARSYRNSQFIITSRIAGYGETPLDAKIFKPYIVQPMEDEDISTFVKSRFGEDSEEAANVLSALDGSPEIKGLTANLLQLTIFSMVHRQIGNSPAALKRTDFFRKATEVLTQDQDDEGQSVQSDDFRTDLLAAVAHRMHQAGDDTIGKEPLKRFAVEFLEGEKSVQNRNEAMRRADEFIRLTEHRSGLLVERSNGDNQEFGFLHSTFREYLAAEFINARHYTSEPTAYWEEIRGHLEDARWREVILFLLGILEREYCSYLTEKILAAGDEASHQPSMRELPAHLQLAAGALANQAHMSAELQQEIVGRLESVVRGNNPGFTYFIGFSVVRALGTVRHLPELVNPILANTATDPNIPLAIRVYAAKELGRLGETDTAVDTLSAIAGDESLVLDLRASAAEGLGRLGETDMAADVQSAILSELSHRWTRIAADPSASTMEKVRVEAEMAEVLSGDRKEQFIASLRYSLADPEIGTTDRITMAVGLLKMGEWQEGITGLEELTNDDTVDDHFRVIAAMLLCEMGLSESARPAMSSLTAVAERETSEPSMRVAASKVLADLGVTRIAKAALTAVVHSEDADPEERVDSAKILANLGERVTSETVLQTLADDLSLSDVDRSYASEALREMNNE